MTTFVSNTAHTAKDTYEAYLEAYTALVALHARIKSMTTGIKHIRASMPQSLKESQAIEDKEIKPLVASLTALKKEYTQRKRELHAQYGESALTDLHYDNLCRGTVVHVQNLATLKSQKWRKYRIDRLVQYLEGKQFQEVLNLFGIAKLPKVPALYQKDPTFIALTEQKLYRHVYTVLFQLEEKLEEYACGRFTYEHFAEVKKARNPAYRAFNDRVFFAARACKQLVALDQELKALYLKKTGQAFPDSRNFLNFVQY